MIVKVGLDGTMELDQLFTKETIKKIDSYSMYTTDNAIIVTFSDVDGKSIPLKLRKRAKTKKA